MSIPPQRRCSDVSILHLVLSISSVPQGARMIMNSSFILFPLKEMWEIIMSGNLFQFLCCPLEETPPFSNIFNWVVSLLQSPCAHILLQDNPSDVNPSSMSSITSLLSVLLDCAHPCESELVKCIPCVEDAHELGLRIIKSAIVNPLTAALLDRRFSLKDQLLNLQANFTLSSTCATSAVGSDLMNEVIIDSNTICRAQVISLLTGIPLPQQDDSIIPSQVFLNNPPYTVKRKDITSFTTFEDLFLEVDLTLDGKSWNDHIKQYFDLLMKQNKQYNWFQEIQNSELISQIILKSFVERSSCKQEPLAAPTIYTSDTAVSFQMSLHLIMKVLSRSCACFR
jgi:hypothetical protein